MSNLEQLGFQDAPWNQYSAMQNWGPSQSFGPTQPTFSQSIKPNYMPKMYGPANPAPASWGNFEEAYLGKGASEGFDGGLSELQSSIQSAGPSWGKSFGNGSTGPGDWMPDWLKSAIGTKDNPGWGGLALGGIQTGMGLYTGLKQLGLAKDSLNFQKKAYAQNFASQQQTMNTAMEDRQKGRVAANPNATPVDQYMDQNRIKKL